MKMKLGFQRNSLIRLFISHKPKQHQVDDLMNPFEIRFHVGFILFYLRFNPNDFFNRVYLIYDHI